MLSSSSYAFVVVVLVAVSAAAAPASDGNKKTFCWEFSSSRPFRLSRSLLFAIGAAGTTSPRCSSTLR